MKKVFLKVRSVTAIVLLLALIVTCFSVTVLADTYEATCDYNEYLAENKENESNLSEITIDGNDLLSDSFGTEILTEYCGLEGNIVLTETESTARFSVNVPVAGYYNLQVKYIAMQGKGADIIREIKINDKLPFDEARNIEFPRLYRISDKKVYDKEGNQIQSETIQVFDWQTKSVYDAEGYSSAPLKFYFEEGENILSFISVNEPMAISHIKLYQYGEPMEYSAPSDIKKGNDEIILQGESPALKSEQSIIPLTNKSSPMVDPVCTSKNVYNTIGGTNWQYNGQTLTYKFTVKEAGHYKIGIKFIQNFTIGSVSYRKVYIDGKIPYSELQSVKFEYTTKWSNKVLGTEEPFAFWFDKGEHTISFECTLGEVSQILQMVKEEVEALNETYRDILMIVGANPDVNRDYQFEKFIPQTIKNLKVHADNVLEIYNSLVELYGMEGSDIQFLKRFNELLQKMYDDTSYVADEFANFQTYISSMGNFLTSSQYQPLTIDYISIIGVDKEFKPCKAGFFSSLLYNGKLFLYSFIDDYAQEEKTDIEVWFTAGREPAQIIRNLSENEFSTNTGYSAQLQLVSAGALIPSIFAGTGPDVVLGVSSTEAANLAFRGATVDLSKLKGYDDVIKRFHESALMPLCYEGNTYALPENQTFPVMFYRTDILSELEIDVPKTWDDVITILPILQKKQMNFGIPTDTFFMLMYQKNENIYSDDFTKVNLDNKKVIEIFDFFTELYGSYEIPQTFDFMTRFKMGTIPIGITSYTAYNQLSIYAPEIRNVWKFTSVPGYEDENGNINNTTLSTVTGCVILNSSKNIDASWEYLKWWTSAETQYDYGIQVENVLGIASRSSTANIEAFEKLPWKNAELNELSKQRETACSIPEAPGSYYLTRNFNFAFRKVVNNDKNPGESLIEAANAINAEITLKRKELGLKLGDDK